MVKLPHNKIDVFRIVFGKKKNIKKYKKKQNL